MAAFIQKGRLKETDHLFYTRLDSECTVVGGCDQRVKEYEMIAVH